MPEDLLVRNRASKNSAAPAGQPEKEHLGNLLYEEQPLYASLLQQLREWVHPPKLPPLQLTSKPVPVKALWGEYRYGKVAKPTSLAIHLLILTLLIVPFGRRIISAITAQQFAVTAIQLSPDRKSVV